MTTWQFISLFNLLKQTVFAHYVKFLFCYLMLTNQGCNMTYESSSFTIGKDRPRGEGSKNKQPIYAPQVQNPDVQRAKTKNTS